MLGGGAATIQQFLRAGLIDEMHVVIMPIMLGDGERLLDNLASRLEQYECVELVSSNSATHARITRSPEIAEEENSTASVNEVSPVRWCRRRWRS
jgi:dihydrofolate reductase